MHQAIQASERREPLVTDLMEKVIEMENLIRARERVRANKGSSGIDRMTRIILFYPDKTALRGIKPQNLDDFQLFFDFG